MLARGGQVVKQSVRHQYWYGIRWSLLLTHARFYRCFNINNNRQKTPGKPLSCSNAFPWLFREGMRLPSGTPWLPNETPLHPLQISLSSILSCLRLCASGLIIIIIIGQNSYISFWHYRGDIPRGSSSSWSFNARRWWGALYSKFDGSINASSSSLSCSRFVTMSAALLSW